MFRACAARRRGESHSAGSPVTYAADWSEYFGHQPPDGSGDAIFHLDPLWSDANIDAVALDNYWPLSDWRRRLRRTSTRLLKAGWDADRDHRLRLPDGRIFAAAKDMTGITQARPTATGKSARRLPTEDMASPGFTATRTSGAGGATSISTESSGVESLYADSLGFESKPIWFTELGCPSIDKGSNQPNVFYDPKSSESARSLFLERQRRII